MKQALQCYVLLWVLLLTGCASTGRYFENRGRDASDILTVTFGNGSGVKTRLGPINAGLLWNEESSGLRNGEFFNIDVHNGNLEGQCFALGFDHAPYGRARRKSFTSQTKFLLALPRSAGLGETCSSAYYTQVEAIVGLGITCRLGFNPGELLDFILGWTTIDIYNDDIERKKQEETIEQDE